MLNKRGVWNKETDLTSISHIEIHRLLGVFAGAEDGYCLRRMLKVSLVGKDD